MSVQIWLVTLCIYNAPWVSAFRAARCVPCTERDTAPRQHRWYLKLAGRGQSLESCCVLEGPQCPVLFALCFCLFLSSFVNRKFRIGDKNPEIIPCGFRHFILGMHSSNVSLFVTEPNSLTVLDWRLRMSCFFEGLYELELEININILGWRKG